MPKKDRGFASMDPEKQRSIASKGGKTAHEKGRAHQWVGGTEEHLNASRKGGEVSHRKSQARHQQPQFGTESGTLDPK